MSSAGAAARREGRRAARAAAVQLLYACQVGGLSPDEALAVLEQAGEADVPTLGAADRAFAERLVRGVMTDAAALDERLGEAARHWRVERMAVVDRLVLRLAVYEWLAVPETPPRVVINEAIELARVFSGGDAVRFVNGVLDGVYQTLRQEGRLAD